MENKRIETKNKEEKSLKKKKHHWHYKGIILLALSIVLAVFLLLSPSTKLFISSIGELKYIGIFITGFFFAFGFTTAPAAAVFIVLGDSFNPLIIGLIGGFGAMISDYLIFKYVKSNLPPDIKYIIHKAGIDKLRKLKKTKFHWLVPFLPSLYFSLLFRTNLAQ